MASWEAEHMSAYQTEPVTSQRYCVRVFDESGELVSVAYVKAPSPRAAVIQSAEGDGTWENY